MSRMSYSEQKDSRQAKDKALREKRKARKKKIVQDTNLMMKKLRKILRDCGLTRRQISQFSGLEFSTVDKIMRGYGKALNVISLNALLKAAGYYLEIKPKTPRNDEFRQERRLQPPPIED